MQAFRGRAPRAPAGSETKAMALPRTNSVDQNGRQPGTRRDNTPTYPVALKGRAWIAADTYQVVRLETGLAAPLPQIRLFADRTEIDYGPVKFRDKDVQMWLPQSAEVFYDWKGRRIHRRHSFSNYLLFDVNDQQKISKPKSAEDEEPEPAAKPGKPNN
jgi:hypothetical protein